MLSVSGILCLLLRVSVLFNSGTLCSFFLSSFFSFLAIFVLVPLRSRPSSFSSLFVLVPLRARYTFGIRSHSFFHSLSSFFVLDVLLFVLDVSNQSIVCVTV